jgi:site-specific DNA-cytosine methylase
MDKIPDMYKVAHGSDKICGSGTVHFGPEDGDILATPMFRFPSANVIVCGPPCPPFSSIGSRFALSDDRARPFDRCTKVIRELDRRSKEGETNEQLMFFVIENVTGILSKTGPNNKSPLHSLLADLRQDLGASWIVTHVVVNTSDYGLPQNRPRVYVVGRNSKFYRGAIPARPPTFERTVTPRELLDTSDNKATTVTHLHSHSINEWKLAYKSKMLDPANRGKFAFVEAWRDPAAGNWGSLATPVDKCQCLRASGPQIHVFALGEGEDTLSLDRPLRIRERAALQGFPIEVGTLAFSETSGRRIFGNAMSVPVVGSILAQELLCIQATLLETFWSYVHQEFKPSETPGHPMPPPVPTLKQSAGPGPRTLHHYFLNDQGEGDARDDEDILIGQRTATVAWAKAISEHWGRGESGRATKPPARFLPSDHHAMATRQVRQRVHSSSSSSSNAAALPPATQQEARHSGAEMGHGASSESMGQPGNCASPRVPGHPTSLGDIDDWQATDHPSGDPGHLVSEVDGYTELSDSPQFCLLLWAQRSCKSQRKDVGAVLTERTGVAARIHMKSTIDISHSYIVLFPVRTFLGNFRISSVVGIWKMIAA